MVWCTCRSRRAAKSDLFWLRRISIDLISGQWGSLGREEGSVATGVGFFRDVCASTSTSTAQGSLLPPAAACLPCLLALLAALLLLWRHSRSSSKLLNGDGPATPGVDPRCSLVSEAAKFKELLFRVIEIQHPRSTRGSSSQELNKGVLKPKTKMGRCQMKSILGWGHKKK